MFFRSTRFVLGRFHRPVDRCGVPSVYPVTAGQGCCRLVRTRPSIVSLQYRRFRQSGKYLPHSAQIEIMPTAQRLSGYAGRREKVHSNEKNLHHGFNRDFRDLLPFWAHQHRQQLDFFNFRPRQILKAHFTK